MKSVILLQRWVKLGWMSVSIFQLLTGSGLQSNMMFNLPSYKHYLSSIHLCNRVATFVINSCDSSPGPVWSRPESFLYKIWSQILRWPPHTDSPLNVRPATHCSSSGHTCVWQIPTGIKGVGKEMACVDNFSSGRQGPLGAWRPACQHKSNPIRPYWVKMLLFGI